MKVYIILFILLFGQNLYGIPSKLKAKNLKNSFSVRKRSFRFKYEYKLHHKSNPFLPPVIEDLKPKMEIQIVHELQKYSLSELKLAGTWKIKDKGKRALIMTPAKKSFTTDIGHPIGRKGGQISEIKENSITVTYHKLLSNGNKEEMTEFLYVEEKSKLSEKVKPSKEIITITPTGVE